MNVRRLLKALGLAIALMIGMQFVFQGGFWVLMKLPKWMSMSILCCVAIVVCTACFYKAFKIQESIDE